MLITLFLSLFIFLLIICAFFVFFKSVYKYSCTKKIRQECWVEMKIHASLYPPKVTGDVFSLPSVFLNNDVLVAVFSLALEYGFFEYIFLEKPTLCELFLKFKLPERLIKSLLSVLGALELLIFSDGKCNLTSLGKQYFLKNSIYYVGDFYMIRALSSPKIREIKRSVIKGKVCGGTIQRWAKGLAKDKNYWGITMHRMMLAPAHVLAEQSIFKEVKSLLDMAGGVGTVCMALLARYPSMQLTLVDLPQVIDKASEFLENHGVRGDIMQVGLNMFEEPWPEGSEVILFSNIFHDWSFDTCLLLAKKAYQVLPSGGKILLHEQLFYKDGFSGPLITALFSFQMLVTMQGQQFTSAEVTELVEKAGFGEVSVVLLSTGYSLISAYKP